MPKSRPPYPPEFRRQRVELVHAGRTPEELAREFEPTAQAIRNWVRQADRDTGRRDDGLTSSEREEIRAMATGGEAVAPGAGDPGKSRGRVRSGDRRDFLEAFEFVKVNQAAYPMATMGRLLEVSPSGDSRVVPS